MNKRTRYHSPMVMARISYDLHKIVKLLYTVDIPMLFFFLPKRKIK